jgi:hypothetical protein
MKRVLSFALACLSCVCLLMATERRAMAMYVDPGSGLFMLQSGFSVLAAGAYFFRRKLRALFGGREKTSEVCVPLPAEKDDARKVA